MTKSDDETAIDTSLIDISRCETVCMMLGPYRNLTTLIAATLFLHPNCQVLNHAGVRIFGNDAVDFLADFSRERFDNFIRYAIAISAEGERGDFGGSITHSHAFESRHAMKAVFDRSGSALLKPEIRCLFWKESQRVTNILRSGAFDLQGAFDLDSRIRFLMPVRNPMDCAVSNLNTGHVQHFPELESDASVVRVMEAILDEIRWFADNQERHPQRFLFFFQHEIGRDLFVRLGEFLGLEVSAEWLDDAMAVAIAKGGYAHDAALLEAYEQGVKARFKSTPALMEGLLGFLDSGRSLG